MVKQIDKYYPVKVWVGTLLMAPLLFLLPDSVGGISFSKFMGGIGFYLLSVCFGIALSFPAFAILYGLFLLVRRWQANRYLLKIFFIGTALVFMSLSVKFFVGDLLEGEGEVLPYAYGVAIILAGWKSRIASTVTLPIKS